MASQRHGQGVLISFEGGEGSGKSTQMKRLVQRLRKQRFPVVVTLEPGGTRAGIAIRDVVLNPKYGDLSPRAELLLYLADRAQHVEQLIRPSLKAGKIVLTDRYADSTNVYQGICRGLGLSRTLALNDFATRSLMPDLVIVLDVPERVSRKRLKGRKKLDRLEREKRSFHEKVRRGFLLLARKYPRRFSIIDSTQSKDEVQEKISGQVNRVLRRKRWPIH